MRIFTLQNLDEWQQAELALRQAREFAQRSGNTDRAAWANAAVLRYWVGEWDDALAELGPEDADGDAYLRERWPALLDPRRRRAHRRAPGPARDGRPSPSPGPGDGRGEPHRPGEPGLPRRRARASALEQDGEARQASLRLAAMLPRRDSEMTLVHQWMPEPGPARSSAAWRQADGADRGPRLRGRGRGRDPARPGPPRPACGATGSSSQTRPPSATLSRTTGRPGRW